MFWCKKIKHKNLQTSYELDSNFKFIEHILLKAVIRFMITRLRVREFFSLNHSIQATRKVCY